MPIASAAVSSHSCTNRLLNSRAHDSIWFRCICKYGWMPMTAKKARRNWHRRRRRSRLFFSCGKILTTINSNDYRLSSRLQSMNVVGWICYTPIHSIYSILRSESTRFANRMTIKSAIPSCSPFYMKYTHSTRPNKNPKWEEVKQRK